MRLKASPALKGLNNLNAYISACQCHGHSTECIYDDDIALQGLSMDIYGNFEGGGVCQNCRHNTEGINCEKCSFGFYRDPRVGQDSPNACRGTL